MENEEESFMLMVMSVVLSCGDGKELTRLRYNEGNL
jgi:hypothetical protein